MSAGSAAGTMQPSRFERLEIKLRAGSLEVRETAGDAVSVQLEVLAKPGTFEAKEDGSVVLAEWLVVGEANGVVTMRPQRSDSDHELRLKVQVPRGARIVDLYAAAGAIDVELDTARSIILRTEAGDVRCVAGTVEEQLKGRATTGNVAVKLTGTCPDLDVEVAAGRVELALPKGVEGAFDFDVDVGGLEGFKAYGLQQVRTVTSASAKGRRGDAKATYKVHVGTGQIDLR